MRNETEAQSYNSIATGIFAPLYAYYARQIVAKTGIHSGCCLDIGCGGGHLGMALLQITDLSLILLDRSRDMLRLAGEKLAHRGNAQAAGLVLAAVQAIPLRDASMDLVVSRGSVPFWEDLPEAFREIRRILRPGGRACIFGGLGPPEMRKAIEQQMRLQDPNWQSARSHTIPRRKDGQYDQALRLAGIEQFTVVRNDTGMWIEYGN
jgi:ubiquinone/menaquinone biosynthesis C-methylase UbiE